MENENLRNGLQSFLKERGIPSMIYYPKPMSRQTAFQKMDCVKVKLRIAEDICKRILALPLHPYMGQEEQNMIIKYIKDFKRG